ncbi:methyl-accepting chemotaxis protein [Paenibacillus chartarius]|uniref:Methyl-accepting chemotaxis protein n=1 Tax=Paenibacillus chartarius TaxID=747481 RepID=A0ABV6DR16_9BACL
MHPRLAFFLENLTAIQNLFFDGAAMLLADDKIVLESLSSDKISFNNKGMPVDRFKGSVSYKALTTGKLIKEERGPEMFGFPYFSTAVPIFDDDGKTVIGVISASTTNEMLNKIRHEASNLFSIVEKMSATTVQISSGSQSLANDMKGFSAVSQAMVEDIQKIRKTLEFVQEVAGQSNLLGLNAAIESARVGEAGRGFSIVAQEIRRMADKSKEASLIIKEQLSSIQASVKQFESFIHTITHNTDLQAMSLFELNQSFEHIVSTAENLANN